MYLTLSSATIPSYSNKRQGLTFARGILEIPTRTTYPPPTIEVSEVSFIRYPTPIHASGSIG
ncbi:hypothetical protein ACHAWF_011071 [Thalassiosira exigua]